MPAVRSRANMGGSICRRNPGWMRRFPHRCRSARPPASPPAQRRPSQSLPPMSPTKGNRAAARPWLPPLSWFRRQGNAYTVAGAPEWGAMSARLFNSLTRSAPSYLPLGRQPNGPPRASWRAKSVKVVVGLEEGQRVRQSRDTARASRLPPRSSHQSARNPSAAGTVDRSKQTRADKAGSSPLIPSNRRKGKTQCSEAACAGLGGNAGLVSVPRSSASAVCSALSSFASLGT
jgi:hypothetical protein